MAARPRVVIIGAGFGGLAAAKGFAGAPVDVTIIDRNNFHTFQPLLYQVATAGLNAADIAHPVRDILRRQDNVSVRQATVTGCHWDTNTLLLRAADGHAEELPFDQLIVAAGAAVNYFGVQGASECAFPLYNLADAVRLRNHVLSRFEAADADARLIDDGALRVVVVGGGPTGVEVAGALAELFDRVLRRDFRNLAVDRAEVLLLEMSPHLLGAFSDPSQRHALDQLEARGVAVRRDTTVAAISPKRVTLASGEEIASHTLVWAAGVRASSVVGALGLDAGPGGRVTVDGHLRVPDHPGVWAIGDVAAASGADGRPLPQLAPVAMQAGRYVAKRVVDEVAGRPVGPAFHYRDKGTMATIGRRAAVAELPGHIRLSGSPAWMAWLGLHLVFLVGFRNRFSVFLNWAWNYVTWDRGPRLIFDQTDPDHTRAEASD